MGDQEEDFFLIREILERTRSHFAANWTMRIRSTKPRVMLRQKAYGLVLFEHETGDAEAVHVLVSEFLHAGVSVPFILLTEDADETNRERDDRGRRRGTAWPSRDSMAPRWCAPSGARWHCTPCRQEHQSAEEIAAEAVARGRAVRRHRRDHGPSRESSST